MMWPNREQAQGRGTRRRSRARKGKDAAVEKGASSVAGLVLTGDMVSLAAGFGRLHADQCAGQVDEDGVLEYQPRNGA